MDVDDEEIVLNRQPRKRKLEEDLNVTEVNDLKLKVRRSCRLLKGKSSGSCVGSVYIDFPMYKDACQVQNRRWKSRR